MENKMTEQEEMENRRTLNDVIDSLETIFYTLGKPLGKKSKEELKWYAYGLKVKVIELKNKMMGEIN